MVQRPRSKSGSWDNKPFTCDRHDAFGLHNSVTALNLSSIALIIKAKSVLITEHWKAVTSRKTPKLKHTLIVMVYEVTKQQFLLWVVFATYFRTHKRGVQNLREWTNQDSYGRAGRRPSAAKVPEQSQKENDRKATLQTHSIKAPIIFAFVVITC